ncbi:bifunctional metallophosphatase/5'-nucleotidase [Rhodohalobacter sp. 8-1]|uniref:bifunctional metallophosphatase/5'-nucleotidase n=1 Tax=Rhodohalobacter sp. 8-1 TaxID=3131972 RepID=UPI0030ECD8CA
MMNRRTFLRQALTMSAGTMVAGSSLFRGNTPRNKLTILYTNDTHARLDPFPCNAIQFAGLGGIARRANLVKQIRKQENNVLLFDAGDVFQGTPWFDVYGGEVDLELMSEMNYDAMAVGNHEFDNGLQAFADAASKAEFPILAANYGTRNTPLNDVIRRFFIKETAGIKIGIFGLGIGLNGVVDPELYGAVRSRDPEIWANGMVRSLREFNNCDLVICLSHLGFRYGNPGRMDDVTLAGKVDGIDLIIGGHTHTFLDQPEIITSPSGSKTIVTQMGHSGIRLGRIDINLDTYLENRATDSIHSEFYTIGPT